MAATWVTVEDLWSYEYFWKVVYVLQERVSAYPLRVRQQKRPPEQTSPGFGVWPPSCQTGRQSAAWRSRWRKRLRPPWGGVEKQWMYQRNIHPHNVLLICLTELSWSSGGPTQPSGHKPKFHMEDCLINLYCPCISLLYAKNPYLIFVMGMQVSLSIVSYNCLFLKK